MAGEFTTPETMEVLHEAALQPSRTQKADNPVDWVRKNLFNSWYNSLITVVLGAITIYVAYRLLVADGLPMDRQGQFVPVPARATDLAIRLTARPLKASRARLRPPTTSTRDVGGPDSTDFISGRRW